MVLAALLTNILLRGFPRIARKPIDSLFKDFLQEISERRPPDKHAVGSPGDDGVDMFDILRAQLAIKLLGRQSTHSIVIAGYDLEKAKIFINLIWILDGVFELITKIIR